LATHVPVDAEPTADHKPPALLALLAGTCSSGTLWSPSFLLDSFALDRVVIWVLGRDGSPAPSNLEGAGSPRFWALFLANAWALFWSSVMKASSSSEFNGAAPS
jgi:hypothetical protein